MEPEPLKYKREYVDDFELRVEEDCHPATVTEVYTEDDIRAAVDWLKINLKQILTILVEKEGKSFTVEQLIDQAFAVA